jgi:high-affinity Fe2+/Pb2+ permease
MQQQTGRSKSLFRRLGMVAGLALGSVLAMFVAVLGLSGPAGAVGPQ